MAQTITVDLSVHGLEKLKRFLIGKQRWLDRKTDEVCRRLAEMGAVKASLNFSRAIYTGNEDHTITVESRGKNEYAVRADGETVLFVEFGTGLMGYGHQEPNGYGAGTYPGKGHWDDPSGWWLPREKNGGHSQHTFGNPPNAPMYKAVRTLEDELERVVREVFES